MKKTMISRGILFLALSVILIATPGCGVDMDTNKTEELEPVEIREYEGVKLSSKDAFRENSIKGPQEVDAESYVLKITGLVTNSKSYTYDEAVNSHQHYKKVVTLDCVEGWSVTILWEGLLVRDLLEEANPLARHNNGVQDE